MRAILTYHSIDPSGSVISVDAATFERQMRWLSRSGLDILPLDRIMDARGDAVSVTFDDAFRNFSDAALPVLLDAGIAVTLFVPASRVGTTNAWTDAPARYSVPEMSLMNWSDVARAAECGVALGGHGRSHVSLPGLSSDLLADEVCGAAAEIRRETGVDPQSFAYPYGDWDQRSADEVRRCYRFGCTTDFRALAAADDLHLLPRLDMFYLRAPGRLESFGTRAFARYIGARRIGRALRETLLP